MYKNYQLGDLNSAYIMGLYEDYLTDPDSVGLDLVNFFQSQDFKNILSNLSSEKNTFNDITNIVESNDEIIEIENLRKNGHKYAKLDPLSIHPSPDISINANGKTIKLKDLYTSNIGYEFYHLDNQDEINWLIDNIEHSNNTQQSYDQQINLLNRITEIDTFEEFLSKHFPAKKWFSIQGEDSLIPMLDKLIELSEKDKKEYITLGMQHRGRISVMATLFQLPYSEVFSYLKEGKVTNTNNDPYAGWMQDVLYHYGSEILHNNIKIKLLDNPSHLELASPVVNGYLKSIQENIIKNNGVNKSMSIITHGDASFSGQGIVSELFNMKNLKPYDIGGTIHIVVNNQIGFTTNPEETKSNGYCTDIAKAYNIPIIHVNADDVESCINVANLSYQYKMTFQKDILIDLVGYRRHGHNEGDEPSFTQPLMYKKISNHPHLKEIYKNKLITIHGNDIENLTKQYTQKWDQILEAELENPNNGAVSKKHQELIKLNKEISNEYNNAPTNISLNTFTDLNKKIFELPYDFTINNRLKRILERKQNIIETKSKLDWSHAELLALGSIIKDGKNIRLTGQDTERGTFSQRHAVLHDINNGNKFIPLNHLYSEQSEIMIKNSPLTEMATLAFEYGYTLLDTENSLVLWEAQFGDFVNNAQSIIDEYISSGYSKGGRKASLIMLLPHGYEGQGPNHSSAHLERYLSLCADSNLRVIYPTKSVQYFHALRMQSKEILNKTPMIIMTPKSLLRHPFAASEIRKFTEDNFKKIITYLPKSKNKINNLILCSGKIIIDLLDDELNSLSSNSAIISVEELYPFPKNEIINFLKKHKDINRFIWIQEEPKNRGAWQFVSNQLDKASLTNDFELEYCGSIQRASTSVGTSDLHKVQTETIAKLFKDIK
ncbi:MAG TPA: 2-oxoglutarate dehydrogenase E1 component [Dehalococcoidia bacterium]|nr:2-oxoglutarate dehydrogenase E1 component [Dehalococcoidia bacterium]